MSLEICVFIHVSSISSFGCGSKLHFCRAIRLILVMLRRRIWHLVSFRIVKGHFAIYFAIFCYIYTFFCSSSFETTCDSAQAFQTAPGVSSLIFSVRIPRLEGPETDQRCCKSRSRGMLHSESHSSPGQELPWIPQCRNPEQMIPLIIKPKTLHDFMNTNSEYSGSYFGYMRKTCKKKGQNSLLILAADIKMIRLSVLPWWPWPFDPPPGTQRKWATTELVFNSWMCHSREIN